MVQTGEKILKAHEDKGYCEALARLSKITEEMAENMSDEELLRQIDNPCATGYSEQQYLRNKKWSKEKKG
jgi:hypothetical protein